MLRGIHRVAKCFEGFCVLMESSNEKMETFNTRVSGIKTVLEEIRDAITAGLPPGQT